MSEPRSKSLADRIREAFEDLAEVLDGLLSPPPELIPVRARPAPRPRRR